MTALFNAVEGVINKIGPSNTNAKLQAHNRLREAYFWSLQVIHEEHKIRIQEAPNAA